MDGLPRRRRGVRDLGWMHGVASMPCKQIDNLLLAVNNKIEVAHERPE